MQLELGMRLNPCIIEQVNGDMMRLVAALMDDPNPIHFDADAVKSIGLGERLVIQGPVTVGFLLCMLGQNLGRADRVTRSEARFLANVFEGDRVECSGEIIAIDENRQIAIASCRARVKEKNVVTLTAEIDLNDTNFN
tara:strand:- start:3756 stop:4169 length:414 start_codon:yes stop_codon:yes gene_type:complete